MPYQRIKQDAHFFDEYLDDAYIIGLSAAIEYE